MIFTDWMSVFMVLAVASVAAIEREDILDFEHKRPNQFSRVTWLDKPDQFGSLRRRREAEESSSDPQTLGGDECKDTFGGDIDQKVKDSMNVKWFDDDSNPSIALAWTGDDGQIILAVTTFESFVSKPSHVYRSTDGGKTWNEKTNELDGEMIRRKSGVLTSTADSSRVIMVVNNHPIGYSDTSNIYITLDKGENWKRYDVPFELNGANVKFHPTNPDAMLATDASTRKLYVTRDFGKNWKAVHDSGSTHSYKWDPLDKEAKIGRAHV